MILLTVLTLLLSSCTTTKYVYTVPDVTFPKFPSTNEEVTLKLPGIYAAQVSEYAKSNNLNPCVTVHFSGTKSQFQSFEKYLSDNGIPYDDTSYVVDISIDNWFSIVDYKLDVDKTKNIIDKMKENTK